MNPSELGVTLAICIIVVTIAGLFLQPKQRKTVYPIRTKR